MARNVIRDEKVREERKQLIMDSVLQLIVRKGVGSLNISEIAKEAKLSVGNIYNFFKSKDEILDEILRKGQEEYRVFVTKVAEREDITPIEKLHFICSSWLSLKNNWAFTMMIQSIRMNETVREELKTVITRRFTQNLQPIEKIMKEGQEQEIIINENPLELAYYFVSLIQGLTLQQIPSNSVPIKMNADGIIHLFMKK
ncbi:TetR/AcrR family transcriptional regulator [Metabacillus fastidiosus]|uniref:TetR/AcrR family transcriptional regulator n=1 Tax=Metabacillus fastidiosus TaxID=1458 RepID=UPI002E216DEA|nr:TetR/AcrR family transcriptional regulator [Metabacillus fastidiosus]